MTHAEYKKAVGQYLSALPSLNKSERTQTAYKAVLSAFDTFVGKYLADGQNGSKIGKLAVVAWRSALAEQNSNNTVHHRLVCLHAFFVWACRMGLCDENPVDVEDIPALQEVEYNILTYDEIKTILVETPKRCLHEKNTCRNRAIVLLLCMAGLRNSELRHLRLSDLDFENGTISVRHGKGDKSRTVAFPSLARTAVQEYLASGVRPESVGADGLLFGTCADHTGHGNGAEWHEITAQGLLGLVNRYTEKCCGHAVCVHALRHAAASLWDHLNITPSEMQQALGHASITTTMGIYRHVLKSDKAAKSINAALDSM